MQEFNERGDVGGGGAGPLEGKRTVSPTLIGFVVIAVITLIFIFQNSDRTKIHFLFFDPTTRVWTAILVAIALGVILDRLFLAWWRRRRRNG